MVGHSPETAESLLSMLDDLDARQNEVLTQLDDLNERVEQLLSTYTQGAPAEPTALPKAA